MLIRLLHLNIEGGRTLPEVVHFLKKKQYDVIHLQEVNGGTVRKSADEPFPTVKESLGYFGELSITMRKTGDPTSYFANATLYKPEFSVLQHEIVWLEPYKEFERYDPSDIPAIKKFSRNAIALLFGVGDKKLWFINTHLAWGPDPYDEPYKIEQGKILYNFLAALKDPFVLSGDFNVEKDSQIVQLIDKIGVNHAVLAGIKNTLNPHLHRSKYLFPPGLAVDFIYTNPSLQTSGFHLVDTPDLSDHFGLEITIEI